MGQQGVELRLRASAPRSSLKDFRKDIIIEVYNEAGQLALAYKVYRCWVSEFQALPDLDANANAVAIQTHQARERGLGARLRRDRADRAELHRAGLRPTGALHAMRDVPTLDDAALLELWDAAIGCDPWQREDLLVATATGGVALRTPGARNVALLRWRQRLLGRSLPLRANCSRCASELDLTLDIEVLCDVPASAANEATLRLDGWTVRLRPPTVDDLRDLSARHADVDALAARPARPLRGGRRARRGSAVRRFARPSAARRDGRAPRGARPLRPPRHRARLPRLRPRVDHAARRGRHAVGRTATARRASAGATSPRSLASTAGPNATCCACRPARRAAYLQLAGAA